MRSASPRVPTSENARSRCPSAKSSQAAMNSRLSPARQLSSSRRQAGSTFKKVYLTKCLTGTGVFDDTRGPVQPRGRAQPHDPVSQLLPLQVMRVAILSPYSWTYPGGVTRHIEALAECLIADGHHVRVLAPYDLPDRFGSVLHRGARPQPMEQPEYLVSL